MGVYQQVEGYYPKLLLALGFRKNLMHRFRSISTVLLVPPQELQTSLFHFQSKVKGDHKYIEIVDPV